MRCKDGSPGLRKGSSTGFIRISLVTELWLYGGGCANCRPWTWAGLGELLSRSTRQLTCSEYWGIKIVSCHKRSFHVGIFKRREALLHAPSPATPLREFPEPPCCIATSATAAACITSKLPTQFRWRHTPPALTRKPERQRSSTRRKWSHWQTTKVTRTEALILKCLTSKWRLTSSMKRRRIRQRSDATWIHGQEPWRKDRMSLQMKRSARRSNLLAV